MRARVDNHKGLPLLALALGSFFVGGLVSRDLSLMSVGVFYGILNGRYRKYLVGTVASITLFSLVYGMINVSVMYGSIMSFFESIYLRDAPIAFKLPEWLNVFIVPAIILLAIVGLVCFITMLPKFVVDFIGFIPIYVFVYVSTPIFYPGLPSNEIINAYLSGNDIWLSMLEPMMPWIYTILVLERVLLLPAFTYLYLKWVGFYKRININH